jgi:uncharacterized protein (TIGR02594 family)
MSWLQKLFERLKEWFASFKELEPPSKDITPPWMDIALGDLELDWREISGTQHNRKISEAFDLCGYGLLPDETAWCGVYAGSRLKTVGYMIPSKCAWARHFTTKQDEYGVALARPEYGCVVNVERGSAGGTSHVGFLAGWDDDYVRILGGNQADNVTDSLVVPRSKVLSFTWPLKAV